MVACPVCGADGTATANEIIAFTLSAQINHREVGRHTVMYFGVVGCLIAGIAGVIKAMSMARGFDVLLCLLGAVGAFGMALAVYFWKR